VTLIATYAYAGCPVLFGDLLVTGPRPSGTHDPRMPVLGPVNDFFGDSDWAIHRLAQKVAIINNHCAIAWAGSWLGARIAISSLRKLGESRRLSISEVQEYLDGDLDLREYEVSIIGLLASDRGVQQFHWHAELVVGGVLGECAVDGSGRDAFAEFVAMFPAAAARRSGEANGIRQAVSSGLWLAAQLLTAELHQGWNARTLLQMFGGGYEVVVFDPGMQQMCKLPPETTYVFWEALNDGKTGSISKPLFVIKQRYLCDFLLIRSLTLEVIDEGRAKVGDQQRLVVAPMYDVAVQPRLEELNQTTLQSELFCHCVLIRGIRGSSIYTRIEHSGQGPLVQEPRMRIVEHGDRFEVLWSGALLSDIAQFVERA
jgi:hypothetical protein